MLRYYLSAIGIATAIVAALNAIFASSLGFSPLLLILLTVAFVLFAFLVDGVIACLARVLPKKLFEPDRKRFAVYASPPAKLPNDHKQRRSVHRNG